MVTALVLAVVVSAHAQAAHDPIVVVASSKRGGGADSYGTLLVARVRSAMREADAAAPLDDEATAALLKRVGLDPRTCQGATRCLTKAAQQLGPQAVVIGVDVGKIGGSLAVHLEAVSADSTLPLAGADFTAAADAWAKQAAQPVAAFVARLSDRLAAPAAARAARPEVAATPVGEAPSARSLVPPERVPSPGELAVGASTPMRRVAPWATAAVGAAALIASGVCFALGQGEKQAVDRSLSMGGTLTELTQSEFVAHQGRGNTDFSVSLSMLVLGLALGVGSGVMFGVWR